jgi:hypothetical protein
LLRQLLNSGGFHAAKMPRNAPRRKLTFAHETVAKLGAMLPHSS